MNNKLVSIRRRPGGWVQVRSRYFAVYVRLGKGAVFGDYTKALHTDPSPLARDLLDDLSKLEERVDAVCQEEIDGRRNQEAVAIHAALDRFTKRLQDAKGTISDEDFRNLKGRTITLVKRLLRDVFKIDPDNARV